MKNDYKKILLVRTDRIGDVVLTLPCVKIIKENYPDVVVHFLGNEYTAPLIEANSYVDKIHTIQNPSKVKVSDLISLLRKEKFDICIVFHPRPRIAWAAFLAGIKIRIGTAYRWYSFLFNSKVFDHRKTAEYHELEYNLRMLKKLNISAPLQKKDIDYGIKADLESEQKIRQKLSDIGIDLNKKSIIIHPGSGGSSEDWPIIRFIELTSMMASGLNVNIILTGSKNEFELCEKIKADTNSYNVAGKFDLKEFIALINNAEILIANSTGPIHIAAALGKYVIGFYPKITQCSAERWGPYTPKASIFNPSISCGNCTREQCASLNCMNSIETEDVVNSIKNILKELK